MNLEIEHQYRQILNQLYLEYRNSYHLSVDNATMIKETSLALSSPHIAINTEPFAIILPFAFTSWLTDSQYKQKLLEGLEPKGEQTLVQFFQYFGLE